MVASPLAEALRGIRVLDLSRLLPGPFLTMVLADSKDVETHLVGVLDLLHQLA